MATTDKLKNFLAGVNGVEEKRRVDLVNERGKRAIRPEEELARLRKAVYTLTCCMELLHPEIADKKEIVEMKEYFSLYEGIKREVSEEFSENS